MNVSGIKTTAIALICSRTTILSVLIVINVTIGYSRKISSCPLKCQCFDAFPNYLDNPPTYTPLTSSQNESYALLTVSCQRQQLTLIPKGIPSDNAVLFLAYNQLDHLKKSMFHGLENIQTLDVSHNKISRIDKDAFNGMKKLEHLNIAYNDMTRLPQGFLCPWYYRNNMKTTGAFDCKATEVAKTVIRLNMIQNPWHCDCALQDFVEKFSCKSGMSSCIEFLKDLDSIGQCHTPSRIEGIPITRLSSHGSEGSRNLCRNKSHVDIPMVITMATWFGGIIGYVIYFIRWNQKEMARQSSYLASLGKKSIVSSRMETHESDNAMQGSQSESPYVQTRNQKSRTEQKSINRYSGTQRKVHLPTPSVWVERHSTDNGMNCDGEYAVSGLDDFNRESSSTPQKRRSCISSQSSSQKKDKQEEIYRMSSL